MMSGGCRVYGGGQIDKAGLAFEPATVDVERRCAADMVVALIGVGARLERGERRMIAETGRDLGPGEPYLGAYVEQGRKVVAITLNAWLSVEQSLDDFEILGLGSAAGGEEASYSYGRIAIEHLAQDKADAAGVNEAPFEGWKDVPRPGAAMRTAKRGVFDDGHRRCGATQAHVVGRRRADAKACDDKKRRERQTRRGVRPGHDADLP